ncbi:VOC family protein [Ktedonobacter racemifer]|uniref:Glyoxalase/bleomycin resistance protein/dioxygenase n=1 Tax=Ktedonobacter racemifer DSM 44963 TaxID=485913 RepID=D6U0L9_KTERA|nr:VOC family protein [Ktedonobacter racemifer]EFH82359.1 Glyoxalase/bleomycin resistance protein/dioxygenase [Ktedonobacter racemifer DSM 44963]
MANLVTWFEIPTSDIERAKTFYRTILGIKQELRQENLGGDMPYVFLPMEPGDVSGALVQHPNYKPGEGQGVCVYLVVHGDLNNTLAKVEEAGGSVLIPKMPLGEMSPGYMAQITDSESNRIGLWSAE